MIKTKNKNLLKHKNKNLRVSGHYVSDSLGKGGVFRVFSCIGEDNI